MKTTLQLVVFLLTCVSFAQETTVDLSMQPGYANQVYYKLSTQTETAFAADSWDIAFLRTSSYDFGLRVNDGVGITVYEASNDPTTWDAIDVINEESWTVLNNSDTEWNNGAFVQGSATYGWGEYNMANHHIEGTIIFVLKYADGTFIKFINQDYYGGYTFKYAAWDGTSWGEDKTATVANASNPEHKYNYFSLVNDTEVVAEPAITDWDFVFTKYATDYYGDGSFYYPVTGVLQNAEVTVAQNEEIEGSVDTSNLTFSEKINTIGYDWKAYDSGYVVDENQVFYIKYADNTAYRLHFTAFEGSSTGNISFVYEDVTESLGFADVNENVSFGVYPNPSLDKKINLIYDINAATNTKNKVAIYSTTGRKVFSTILTANTGLYNRELNLSNLQSGIYILQFTAGDFSTTRKIVLK